MTQNIFKANAGTDANGKVDIAFPLIAVNSTFTGIVSIPLAPPGAHILIDFNGQVVASIDGYSQFGPFVLGSSDKLDLIATGMIPNLQYQGVMIGNLTGGPVPQAPTPVPTASNPAAGGTAAPGPVPTLIQSGNLAEGTPSPPIPAPATTRVLIIELDGAGSNIVTVQGTSTGVKYCDRAVAIMGTNGVGMLYVPYDPTADPEFTLEVA